jgi:NAD(P)-dependent dehydrogenase (short-subunit alcohol dehydrogenase family)
MVDLSGKRVLVTGGAHRLGKVMCLAAAKAGAEVIIHYGRSLEEANETAEEIRGIGQKASFIQADLGNHDQVKLLAEKVFEDGPLFGLVNNASIFPPGGLLETSLETWQANMDINLTAPFLLSQEFIKRHQSGRESRIINLLDWRALRPGKDHFGYTISKSGLAALTQGSAIAGAPDISVNAIALGAILPPENEPNNSEIIRNVPQKRWATLDELEETFLFLLTGPAYITGEIIHLDGGRHLV